MRYASYSHDREQSKPSVSFYPLATSAPLWLRTQHRVIQSDISPDLDTLLLAPLCGNPKKAKAVHYWTPTDPTLVHTIEFGKWRFLAREGDLYLFTSGKETLFWLWGAAAGVCTTELTFPADLDKHKDKRLQHSNGAAFVCMRGKFPAPTMLYMLPLSERQEGLPMPLTLPQSPPRVSVRLLYQGLDVPRIERPVGSALHPPLVCVGGRIFSM